MGKTKSGQQNTVKHYTPNSATPIGVNTMFLQIGKRYTPFSALHYLGRQNVLCEIQDGVPLKLKKMSSAPILKHYPPVNTIFDPP
jgi:hypothetical protein